MNTRSHLLVTLLAVAAMTAGCATPLPDGSRIQRLPETAVAAPAAVAPAAAPAVPLSAEEARALTELNARILREQDEARRREELVLQRERDAQLYWGLGYSYGWPYGWHRGRHGGWVWLGSSWFWRPYWGVELWAPLPR
jgi:hypothetical protein